MLPTFEISDFEVLILEHSSLKALQTTAESRSTDRWKIESSTVQKKASSLA
jgi:hypothetical protein